MLRIKQSAKLCARRIKDALGFPAVIRLALLIIATLVKTTPYQQPEMNLVSTEEVKLWLSTRHFYYISYIVKILVNNLYFSIELWLI